MKYKLHGGGKMHDGRKVYRIKALEDFNDVTKGQLGGYIESEANLSQDIHDSSWVYDDSIVYGQGMVKNDSHVYKNAIVFDSRIDNGSSVSRGSNIIHSHINNSIIQDSDTFYANVVNSEIAIECVVKNSTVQDSQIYTYSEVYNSRISDDAIIDDGSHISAGTTISGERISLRTIKNNVEMEHKHSYDEGISNADSGDLNEGAVIELNDADLADLSEDFSLEQ